MKHRLFDRKVRWPIVCRLIGDNVLGEADSLIKKP